MKELLILILSLVAFTSYALSCKSFQDDDSHVSEGYCLNETDQIVYAKMCLDNQECNIIDGQCYEEQRYPGQKCDFNWDCYSNQCSNNICLGKGEGQSCNENKDCAQGLFCGSTCQRQLPKGENCTSSYECQNQYACNGTCIEILSAQIHENCIVDDANFNLSWACQSLYCIDNECTKPLVNT